MFMWLKLEVVAGSWRSWDTKGMPRNARKNLRTSTSITSELRKAEVVVKMGKATSFSASLRLSIAQLLEVVPQAITPRSPW